MDLSIMVINSGPSGVEAMMDEKEVMEKLNRGELKLYQLDEVLGDSNLASELRRKFLEEMCKLDLSIAKDERIDFDQVVGRNIENPIGSVTLPLAVAGPITIHGEYAKGEFFIPLATTEGALVASVNRGCSTITRSGGATARIIKEAQTRAPAFKLESVKEVNNFLEWLEQNFERLKAEAEATSSHLKFLSFQPFVIGKYVYLRFYFDTCDAMGMNMVTIASDRMSKLIERETNAKFISLSSNLCTDKKPSALNLVLGRGKTVVAEARIPEEVLKQKLKTDLQTFLEVWKAKNLLGSAAAGSFGFNAHFANIVAAIYLATGQDAAHVVEGSLGWTHAEAEGNSLYFSVTLPCIQVGAVGGGTRLPVQHTMLKLLGCEVKEEGKAARKLAEITACAVLAGELSLLGALAAHHLAKAHEKLGR